MTDSKQNLIEQLLPAILATGNYSRNAAIQVLERSSVDELLRMKQRQIASGRLVEQSTPAPESVRVPEGIAAAAKQAALQTSEAIENQRLKNEMVQNQGWIIIFNTKIPEAKNRTLKDCDANRSILENWLTAETSTITNPKAWLLKVFVENPSLVEELVWETPPASKADRQAQHQKDWTTFIDFCRTSGRISSSVANFNVIVKTLDSPLRYEELSTQIIDMPNGPALLTPDGDTVELAPQSRAEQETFRQERVQLDQAHLKDMAATNDIAGLRARAQRDHTRNTKTLSQLQFEYSLLKAYGEREQGMPLLPDRWNGQVLDASFIRKASVETLKSIMRVHGHSQMNARLHQLPSDFFNNWQSKLYQIEQEIQSAAGIRSY